MDATLTLPPSELQKLTESMRAIARTAKVDLAKVVDGEAGIILKTCAAETKVANPIVVSARERSRALARIWLTQAERGQVSVNSGVRGMPGRAWFRTRGNKFQLAGNVGDKGDRAFERKHYTARDWNVIHKSINEAAAAINGRVEKARNAIALARQSWVQAADQLGIRLENVKGGKALSAAAIKKARAALATSGKSYVNGTGKRKITVQDYSVLIENVYPNAEKAGLPSVLYGVLARRAKYFERNLRLGVFDSFAKTARAYPYLKAGR